MNWKLARKTWTQREATHSPGKLGFGPPAVSRRQFASTAVRTATAGAVLGAGLWKPKLAEAHWPPLPKHSSEPIPIPGGTPLLGGQFHLFGPTPDGSFDPIDAEPSTITDFLGFLGLAYISGTVTRTNQNTGETRQLPFIASDMRFMKGLFRGVDGKIHFGAFAFV